MITPNYSNGTWGDVVSVTLDDGTTVTPETVGSNFQEERTTVYEKEGCLPAMVVNTVTFEAKKPWDILLESGLLPDLTPIPEPEANTLARRKAERLADLAVKWETTIAAGVTVGDNTFGIKESDVSLLTGGFVLAQTAVAIGAAPAEGPFTLIDIKGNSLSFTLAELTQTLLVYGNTRAYLSKTYADAKSAIESAESIEEISN